VEYDIGDDSYKIPKSSVESIEAGGMAPAYASSSGSTDKDLPVFVPEDSLAGHEDLLNRVVRDGKVDPDALTALEKEGKPALSATACFLAGKHEFEHGNLPQAKRYFQNALGFQPDNSTILNYYAMALVRSGNAASALPYAEQSVRAKPESPDAYTVLGYVAFANDRTKDAIRAWNYAPILWSSSTWPRRSGKTRPKGISRSGRAATSRCATRVSRPRNSSATS
jgi:Flp pilus assembly protein TadD